MLNISKESNRIVDKVYTLKGRAIGSLADQRWIQLNSSWEGPIRPIINTRCAYRAGAVVVFETKSDALEFIDKFMKSPERKNVYPIEWTVIPYRASKKCDYTFSEVYDDEYGKYCIMKGVRYKGE